MCRQKLCHRQGHLSFLAEVPLFFVFGTNLRLLPNGSVYDKNRKLNSTEPHLRERRAVAEQYLPESKYNAQKNKPLLLRKICRTFHIQKEYYIPC